tara:strand:- start:1823 stop:2119 length:297 start_codon:yes stop_codon:yes gene_type:complete
MNKWKSVQELLPCPFCGTAPDKFVDCFFDYVECFNCKFTMLAQDWNVRTDHIVDANKKVTRFEVIDGSYGVVMSRSGISFELSYQDEGRTLKVFLKGG